MYVYPSRSTKNRVDLQRMESLSFCNYKNDPQTEVAVILRGWPELSLISGGFRGFSREGENFYYLGLENYQPLLDFIEITFDTYLLFEITLTPSISLI